MWEQLSWANLPQWEQAPRLLLPLWRTASCALPKPDGTCPRRTICATWIEQVVWEDCRNFIYNPGEALAKAQEQLHASKQQVSTMERERAAYLRALAEKGQERDRVMTMFQRGRLPLQDAEARLDAIAQEEETLRQQCAALDAQKALVEATETHLGDAQRLLEQLQGRLADIEERDDQVAKRQGVECPVHGIRIDTDAQKQVIATITYAFTPKRVASTHMKGRVCNP